MIHLLEIEKYSKIYTCVIKVSKLRILFKYLKINVLHIY